MARAPRHRRGGRTPAQPPGGADASSNRRRGTLCIGGGERDRESERAATTGRGLDPDAPAVRVDDALRDREAEAGTPSAGPTTLPVAGAHVRHVLGGDAGAGVRNREQHAVLVAAGADPDPAARQGELRRVLDQVREYPEEALAVPPDRGEVGLDVGLQL